MKLAHSLIAVSSAQRWNPFAGLFGSNDPEPTVKANVTSAPDNVIDLSTTINNQTTLASFNETTQPAVQTTTVNGNTTFADPTTSTSFNETTQADFESTTIGFNTTFVDFNTTVNFNTTVEVPTTILVNDTTTVPTTAKVIGTTVVVTPGETTTNKFHTTDETTTSAKFTESTTGLWNGTTAGATGKPPITVTYFTTAKPPSDLTRCEQMRFDVLESGIVGAWVPSCDEKGRFEPRQCNNSARTCWCVRPNGEMIEDTSQFLPEWNLDRVRCENKEEHNQDGLNFWDINIHEIISDWLSGGDSKGDSGPEMIKDWLSQSGAANINYAPQNTNVQNFINVNTQVSADINFNMSGKDVNLSDILFRLARHGKDEQMMWNEFEKCLEEFDIKSHVHEYWPMIKKFAEKYGLDANCLNVLEKKLMESF